MVNDCSDSLVEQMAMLDDNLELAGLFKNSRELKDCEGPADLQVLEPAINRLWTEE